MGVSQTLLDLKGLIEGNEKFSMSSESFWNKVWEARCKRRWQVKKQTVTRRNGGHITTKRPRTVSMKKKAHLEGNRRPANGIQRRVKTLKKLIPNSESMDMDGLFRETADYISALEMRVKLMQIIVKVLIGSEE